MFDFVTIVVVGTFSGMLFLPSQQSPLVISLACVLASISFSQIIIFLSSKFKNNKSLLQKLNLVGKFADIILFGYAATRYKEVATFSYDISSLGLFTIYTLLSFIAWIFYILMMYNIVSLIFNLNIKPAIRQIVNINTANPRINIGLSVIRQFLNTNEPRDPAPRRQQVHTTNILQNILSEINSEDLRTILQDFNIGSDETIDISQRILTRLRSSIQTRVNLNEEQINNIAPLRCVGLNNVDNTDEPEFARPENCSICQQSYNDRELHRILPCHHSFHAACVDTWLLITPICPICRQNILAQ